MKCFLRVRKLKGAETVNVIAVLRGEKTTHESSRVTAYEISNNKHA